MRKNSCKVLLLLACLCASQAVNATNYILLEQPQPPTAEELMGPIDFAFTKAPISDRFLLSSLKETLQDKPEFWRDARLSFDLRTYRFRRYNDSDNKPKAHSAGGQLIFESGWWKNLGVRTAFYNSTKISASGPDTGLLEPGADNINVLGEATLRFRVTGSILDGSIIDLYRQSMSLPFINKLDIRQVPSSHEAYTISRTDSNFDYIVGHISKFKNYDSEDFISMAEAAGAEDSNKGVSVIGGRYPFNDDSYLGFGYLAGWDTFDTFYTEGSYLASFVDDTDLRLSVQYTRQASAGEELIGNFNTYQYAAKSALSWRGAILTLAASVTGDGAEIQEPWGGSPAYISLQRFSFTRPDEKALLLGLSWNSLYFSPIGISSFINIAHGWDARDPSTGLDLPDRTEYDITIDYKPPEGLLEGLWVRARYNFTDIRKERNVRDLRLIVNYSLPFL